MKPDCDEGMLGKNITFDINDYNWAGDPWVTYVLYVNVSGCYDSVHVSDILPVGVDFDHHWIVSGSPTPAFEQNGRHLYWNFTCVCDTQYEIRYMAYVYDCGDYTNDVSVVGDGQAYDEDSATFHMIGCGNITVDKFVKPDCNDSRRGKNITFDTCREYTFLTFIIYVNVSGCFDEVNVNDVLPMDLDFDFQWVEGLTPPIFERNDRHLYWNFTDICDSDYIIYYRTFFYEPGSYQNNVTVVGNDYLYDRDSAIAHIIGCENRPPNIPRKPSGPTLGCIEMLYSYSTNTTDPDDDNVKYGWDWNGDDIVDEWTGFYPSGETVTTNHSWTTDGVYDIKVKAEDVHGDQSNFSPSLTVVITGVNNNPPNPPSDPNPENGKTDTDFDKIFSWTGGDPDYDTVTYDIYFGTTNSPPKIEANQSATEFNPSKLQEGTTYYWKIVAWDDQGASTDGAKWSFTTKEDETSPTMEITKPEKSLYLKNVNIRQYLLRKPFIIGKIDITVDATDFESGIGYVEFYIDNELRSTDTSGPYSWNWGSETFGKRTIKVVISDNAGNICSDEMKVWKFF